jgi:hypothetical protein
VLVAGGGYDEPDRRRLVAVIYDPAADAWTDAGAASSGRVSYAASPLLDGRVIFIGTDEWDMFADTADLYDPVADTWTMEDGPEGFDGSLQLGGGRSGHRASLLSDGHVLMTGGSLEDLGPCGTSDCEWMAMRMEFASAEVYDPATSTWSAFPSMTMGRSWHSSTRLLNGRVLIAGGRYRMPKPNWPQTFDATPSTELFSPPGTQGASCASSAACAGGPCVDGVCCDTVCDGPCEACSIAAGAALDGTCGPTTGTLCDDGDACTEADVCQAGVCVGVPSDAASCHGSGGSAGVGGSGEGGAGATGATTGGAGGEGGAAGGGSSSSAGSSGDAGVTTVGSASSSSGSSGAGGDGPGHASAGCSAGGDRAPAGTAANAAWLGALGLLGWFRRRALKAPPRAVLRGPAGIAP